MPVIKQIPKEQHKNIGFDLNSFLDKVFKVFFREKYQDGEDDDLAKMGMNLESELASGQVVYQSISIKDDDIPYIQILCNDPAEMQRLKQVLLSQRFVLCFEQGSKRYFSKWANKAEKEDFKLKMKALK